MRAGGEGEGGHSRCSVHPPTHGREFAGMPHAHLTDYPFVPRGEWRRTRWAMGRNDNAARRIATFFGGRGTR